MDQADILGQVLSNLFPNQLEGKRVEKVLERYGTENYHRESARVRLAILKLAGTDLERIEHYVEQASMDYRDVLAMAEYPGQIRQPYSLKDKDSERYAQIIEEDRKQYEEWLNDQLSGES